MKYHFKIRVSFLFKVNRIIQYIANFFIYYRLHIFDLRSSRWGNEIPNLKEFIYLSAWNVSSYKIELNLWPVEISTMQRKLLSKSFISKITNKLSQNKLCRFFVAFKKISRSSTSRFQSTIDFTRLLKLYFFRSSISFGWLWIFYKKPSVSC